MFPLAARWSLSAVSLPGWPAAIRNVHYMVNQKGEKVVISERTAVRTKREKWQKIRPMGEEEEQKKIDEILRNERLQCDPDQARIVAQQKWQQLGDRVQRSGRCRESRPYQPPPPETITTLIGQICSEVFGQNNLADMSFGDLSQKFKFLVRCQQEFGHEVPNSELHRMKTVSEVRQFYQTPVRGISPYDNLVLQQTTADMPKNLHIIPEPLRFNPETDTFFDGISAFPGTSPPELVGLRAKKKYPTVHDNFVWPDV